MARKVAPARSFVQRVSVQWSIDGALFSQSDNGQTLSEVVRENTGEFWSGISNVVRRFSSRVSGNLWTTIKQKDGVFDAKDQSTARMWTLNIKPDSPVLYAILLLIDEAADLPEVANLRLGFQFWLGALDDDPDSDVPNVKGYKTLGVEFSDHWGQIVVPLYKKVTSRQITIKGRGLLYPGHVPTWPEVSVS